MRRGSEKQMERLRHRVGATLGLVFGIGPTMLTGLIPSGLDHAGVVLLGAILGMRWDPSACRRSRALRDGG